MNALAAFSQVVKDATSQLGESDFAQVLSNGIRELIAADDTSLIRYLDAGPPVIEYTLPTKRRGKTILDRYVKGPFLLDPFYRAAEVEGRFGVFRLSTLAPSGFKESEYFRTWYHECSFQDECGLLIKLNSGSINLALGMTDGSRRFSKRQVDQLEAIFPAVEALVRRHWSAPAPAAETFRPARASAAGAGRFRFLSPHAARTTGYRAGAARTQHPARRRKARHLRRDGQTASQARLRESWISRRKLSCFICLWMPWRAIRGIAVRTR